MIRYFSALLLLLISWVSLPGGVYGEVRVDGDEVIFSILAPNARKVFLVGDFNNWNPTVEMMVKEGDRFVSTLFLVAGEYHYKFVVDNKWVADPDNPPSDPKEGSLLALAERGGELVIRSLSREKKPDQSLIPSGRYLGSLALEDGEVEGDQQLDLFFRVDEQVVEARAVLNTRDDSWKISPPEAEVVFDRGYLELNIANGKVTGFENDSTWSSMDPFNLFGNVGVYGYNFGFARRGVAIEQEIIHLKLRAVYSDRIEKEPWQLAAIDNASIAAFASSSELETYFYETNGTLDDEDVFGGEVFFDSKNFKLGYTRRNNRGMHPGLLARMQKVDSLIRTEVHNTREYWNSSTFWVSSKLAGRFSGCFGFGRGDAVSKLLAGSIYETNLPQDVAVGSDAVYSGQEVRFQKSRIWKGGVGCAWGNFHTEIDYERARFDYYPPLYRTSTARIDVAALNLRYKKHDWSITSSISYIHQDYGKTPVGFHYFSPAQNFWLDYGDRLTIENIVGFDLEEYTSFTLALARERGAKEAKGPSAAAGKPPFEARLGGIAGNAKSGLQYVFVRAAYERFLRERIYFHIDARTAHYPDSRWSDKQSFISSYFELGYRTERVEASIGFGLDPVVFDPVRNDYYDIGRLEYLRRAAAGEPVRGAPAAGVYDSTELEYNLLEREKSLQRISALKLEWIVLF